MIFRNNGGWAAYIELNGGDLYVEHRTAICDPCDALTTALVVSDLPLGVDVDIVIGFIVSENIAGQFQVWVDGTLEYNAQGINFGFGTFLADDKLDPTASFVTMKLGQYNHDESTYISGEERIVWCALPASAAVLCRVQTDQTAQSVLLIAFAM